MPTDGPTPLDSIREAFPAPTANLAHEVWQDIAGLEASFANFLFLYAESQERLDFLNAEAGLFFGQLQRLLESDIFVRISKLTDRAETRVGKDYRKNVSLLGLCRSLKDCGRKELALEIEPRISELLMDVRPIRDRRNRSLAHADLDTAVAERSRIVFGITRKQLTAAIDEIGAIFQVVERDIANRTTIFSFLRRKPSVRFVTVRLEDARKAYDEEFRRKTGRQPTPRGST